MKKQTSYSDEYLVNLARQGKIEAYNLLFSRYNNKIKQIIYLSIRDRAYVSDLTQEVLIKIYRYLQYFKEESQFSTWLYRITQNTIKNYYRTTKLRMDSEAEFVDNYHPSIQLSPEYLIRSIEFSEQLETAIATLSEELRCCYDMYILDGQSYEDIAKKMDCPVGTVRSRIFRARKLILKNAVQS